MPWSPTRGAEVASLELRDQTTNSSPRTKTKVSAIGYPIGLLSPLPLVPPTRAARATFLPDSPRAIRFNVTGINNGSVRYMRYLF